MLALGIEELVISCAGIERFLEKPLYPVTVLPIIQTLPTVESTNIITPRIKNEDQLHILSVNKFYAGVGNQKEFEI
jgi:hypothetical protein